jgi:hypothetical protein
VVVVAFDYFNANGAVFSAEIENWLVEDWQRSNVRGER